jgi:metallo-beta-lactamase class B
MTHLLRLRSLILAVLIAGIANAADFKADPPHACDACDTWGKPREPFHIYGNTWFVGGGLTSILITSDQGHVLIDGGLTQTAPQIAANIEKLGFHLEDVKYILNSHTHFDHAGGIAALQRASGASVMASPTAKLALQAGKPTSDDPQFTFHDTFPAVRNVHALEDGETLPIGGVSVRFTPGHTPGGTSWVWQSCERETCLNMVYADSLNSVSAPDFRFTGDAKHPSRVATFEKSIATIESLPCDILITPHPEAIDLDAKLARREKEPMKNPFIDRGACKAYAAGARERLAKRIAEEQATR